MSTELDYALNQWRKRWIVCWVVVGLVGMGLFFAGHEPWYKRLFGVLLFQVLIGGWFLLVRYVQVKAAAQTPGGDVFRGPMPAWRAVMWTCVAAVGVFWFGSDHSWRMAFFAALFCGVFIGGFSFALNWFRGGRGRAWSRKHISMIVAAYTIALSAIALLKLIDSCLDWHISFNSP